MGWPLFICAQPRGIIEMFNNRRMSTRNGLVALAGGGQAGATLLDRQICRVVTVATAGDSVVLPPALAGDIKFVSNAAAANAMDMFPAVGETINALSADAAMSVAANKRVILWCPVDGKWAAVLTA